MHLCECQSVGFSSRILHCYSLSPSVVHNTVSSKDSENLHPDNFFFRKGLVYFSNAKQHTASITTAWLCCSRVQVLDWPTCSPELSPTEKNWPILKHKISHGRPKTAEQLKSYIRQEWDNIPLSKLQQLVSPAPRSLETC